MRFCLYKDAAGEWRWRLLAANNKTVADSAEGYHNRADCIHAIKIIQIQATLAKIWDLSQDPPQVVVA